jgi:hypothetical protein
VDPRRASQPRPAGLSRVAIGRRSGIRYGPFRGYRVAAILDRARGAPARSRGPLPFYSPYCPVRPTGKQPEGASIPRLCDPTRPTRFLRHVLPARGGSVWVLSEGRRMIAVPASPAYPRGVARWTRNST